MTKITYTKNPQDPTACQLGCLKPGDYFINCSTNQIGFVLKREEFYEKKYPVSDEYVPVALEHNYSNLSKTLIVIKISEVNFTYKV